MPKLVPFTCIGDSWPNYNAGNSKSETHESAGGPWYHNVYAGPFCYRHMRIFQHHAILSHHAYQHAHGQELYRCPAGCPICEGEEEANA